MVRIVGYILCSLGGKRDATLFTLAFVFWSLIASSQTMQVYRPKLNRVLFVLDASGSMKENWQGRDKFTIARNLLYTLIDSVEKKNSRVEFAVRLFGYQFPRAEKNCRDSKLLVPFAPNNAQAVRMALNKINPQGMSPMAYSIAQSATDFPADENSLNAIILITDGIENCDGDPCAAARKLSEKRISLRPFVVGLNAGEKLSAQLSCAGKVLDAKDEDALYNTVGVIIKQTINTTTAQVNLLDHNGAPTITNVPFTLYDHYSGKPLYNFIHTLNDRGVPDTLFLNPVGVYDLQVHTSPPVFKKEIELNPGRHNIIALDVPLANFAITGVGIKDGRSVVKVKSGSSEIVQVQNMNEQSTYLQGAYHYNILSLPTITDDTLLQATTNTQKVLAEAGSAYVSVLQSCMFTLLDYNTATPTLVQAGNCDKSFTLNLQPGKYALVFKTPNSYTTELSKVRYFTVESGRQVNLSIP